MTRILWVFNQMSSTTCAEDGGGGATQRSALFLKQQHKSSKKGETKSELWGRRRRSLKSHEHKGASNVLARIGRKASGKGKALHGEDTEEVEAAERRGNEVEATTDPLSSSRSTGTSSGEGGACSLITGEATPAMLYWEHKGLSLLPRWLACAHPTVKLIVTLRDPVQVRVCAWT